MSDELTEAGQGEHHVYRVPSSGDKSETLTRGKHYLGIDAVAWFINKESSYWTDRMASGVLTIELANGDEEYKTALGTYELKGGARFAPVFEKPVLPDRNYRGGKIILRSSLVVLKQDTVLTGILKSASKASLSIVAGMVETATMTGPAQLLGAAGGEIIKGVQDLLAKKGEEQGAVFDFSGLQYGVRPEIIDKKEVYLLLHRGADLKESKLSVKQEGQIYLPYYNNAVLKDGAWLMLRIRKNEEYGGVRPWYQSMRNFRTRVKEIVSNVELGVVKKEDGLKQFSPGADGDNSLFRSLSELRANVRSDGVLTETQAGIYAAQLNGIYKKGIDAIKISKAEPLDQWVLEIQKSIDMANELPKDVAQDMAREILEVAAFRSQQDVAQDSGNLAWTKNFDTKGLAKVTSAMPNTFDIGFGGF